MWGLTIAYKKNRWTQKMEHEASGWKLPIKKLTRQKKIHNSPSIHPFRFTLTFFLYTQPGPTSLSIYKKQRLGPFQTYLLDRGKDGRKRRNTKMDEILGWYTEEAYTVRSHAGSEGRTWSQRDRGGANRVLSLGNSSDLLAPRSESPAQRFLIPLVCCHCSCVLELLFGIDFLGNGADMIR